MVEDKKKGKKSSLESTRDLLIKKKKSVCKCVCILSYLINVRLSEGQKENAEVKYQVHEKCYSFK